MKQILFILSSILFFSSCLAASTESSEDSAKKWKEEWEKKWKEKEINDERKAKNLGEQVKLFLKTRNLEGILSLIYEEVQYNGPRKKFARKLGFDALFPKDWIKKVLETNAEGMGWRGFMLGRGKIWLGEIRGGEFKITSLHVKPTEVYDENVPKNWFYQGEKLGSECFTREWASEDNFQVYKKELGLDRDEDNDFSLNPGQYLSLFESFEPIETNWESGRTLSFVQKLPHCLHRDLKKEYETGTYEHSLITQIPPAICQLMAPFVSGTCEECFLIKTEEEITGTLGSSPAWGIYGLFKEIEGFGDGILPLKYFRNQATAYNYVDSLKEF